LGFFESGYEFSLNLRVKAGLASDGSADQLKIKNVKLKIEAAYKNRS